MSGRFLAVDWGTTNRRVYVIANGEVTHTERDDRGVIAMAGSDFAAEAAAIRARFGDLPLLMAGMVGSTLGWQVAAYVAAPAGLDELVTGLYRIDPRTAIVPGVSIVAGGPDDAVRADVMRGEEVQLLGAIAAGLVPPDALLCQPGTHCKWARVADARIIDFTTAMTGELFALLGQHSILAPQLATRASANTSFTDGVGDGANGDLAARLFGVRANALLGLTPDRDAASFASGLLIGADVAARISPGTTVHLLADSALGELYRAAIETLGGRAILVDSQACFVAGIAAIEEMSR